VHPAWVFKSVVYLSCIWRFAAFWRFSTVDVASFSQDNLATLLQVTVAGVLPHVTVARRRFWHRDSDC